MAASHPDADGGIIHCIAANKQSKHLRKSVQRTAASTAETIAKPTNAGTSLNSPRASELPWRRRQWLLDGRTAHRPSPNAPCAQRFQQQLIRGQHADS
jgi:hypothetical protein